MTAAPNVDVELEEATGHRLTYRPALDGLRAVAVAAVLLYHGDVRWARGGFLGVDVFFVLSGYLITSLLLAEWEQNHSINLALFWKRRARRLLPALLLMLTAVACYAATVGPTSQRDETRGDTLATLLYVSNWRFVRSGQSYFAQFQAPSPLRHTWSLGIEEQWYIVFPLVLGLVLTRFALRRAALALGLLAAAAASAVLMAVLFTPRSDPSRIYYGTDTRVQALLIGAVLATVIANGRAMSRKAQLVVQLAGVIGAALLVVAFVRANETQSDLYRGGFATVAVAAALVVAAVVLSDRGPLGRALAWAPLVAIGLVSYGVYLWHWPIYVVLTPQRTGLTGTALLVLRIFVTLVVASVSYVFVEQPIRRQSVRSGSPTIPALAGVAAVLLAVTVVTGPLSPAGAAVAPTPGPATAAGGPEVFLLGDSVAFNLRTNFPAGQFPGLRVTGSTQLGCGLLGDQLTAEGKIITPGPECVAWHQRMATEILESKPQVGVLMVGSWEQYDRIVDGKILKLGTAEFEQHVDAELSVLLAELDPAARPVAVTNVPCHDTPDFGVGPEPHIVNDENRVRLLNELVARFVASKGPSVHLLDLHGFLCSHGYTETMNGVTLRTDGLHFTPEGAGLVWGWFGPQLEALAAGRSPNGL